VGTVKIKNFDKVLIKTLTHVCQLLDLKKNLISLGVLVSNNYNIQLE